jgi:hypothetical protein
MSASHSAEIRIRQYTGAPECDVVVVHRGREISLRCCNYDQAVRWARIECKTYKVANGFIVERPMGALLAKLAGAASLARSSQAASWFIAPPLTPPEPAPAVEGTSQASSLNSAE